MMPFVHTVDHRVDSTFLPFEEKRVLRRGAPQPLRFDAPAPGLSLVVLRAPHPPEPLRAASGLRLRLARLLVTSGRRLAGPGVAL